VAQLGEDVDGRHVGFFVGEGAIVRQLVTNAVDESVGEIEGQVVGNIDEAIDEGRVGKFILKEGESVSSTDGDVVRKADGKQVGQPVGHTVGVVGDAVGKQVG
jgi:hypothetical protein